MKRWMCGALLCVGVVCGAGAQQSESPFSRRNTWTVFAEYSNTSSHILMGSSRQRELVTLGGGYTRRVVSFKGSELGYHVEVRPIVFESDPLGITRVTYTVESPGTPQTFTDTGTEVPVSKCEAASGSFTLEAQPGFPAESGTYSTTCGRRWTFGQTFSPIGFRYEALKRHAVQPFFTGTLGYMYASRPIPVTNAEAFNFVFDFGPGVEVYRSGGRSIALEWRFHHFSNRGTAPANPGVDNMVYRVAYSFGR